MNEGITVSELAKIAGVAQTVTSKHLKDLSGPRYDYTRVDVDPENLRQHRVTFTPKGRAVLHKMLDTLRGVPVQPLPDYWSDLFPTEEA
jgi:DNA-binding MarR family transcriptional regulator